MNEGSDPFRSPTIESTQPGEILHEEPPPASGLLTAVTVANYVFSAINLLGGIYFLSLVIIDLTADFTWTSDGEPAPFAEAIRIILWIMTSGFILLGLVAAFAGIGVQRRRKWGRVSTIFLGFLAAAGSLVIFLVFLPLTLIYLPYALFVLVVLLTPKYAAAFH